MLEVTPHRKNKVNLADYNCGQDIENRILLSDFSPLDLEVLEEILFSSLKISVKKLSRSLNEPEEKIAPILEKLKQAGLLTVQEDAIQVDKEMRKYFEFQIQRFDPDFRPDMEFLQGILRKVPIHILPLWYSIPRTSNNIFESIIEKHLLTPQIFQRYLADLHFVDPILRGIMNDVLNSSGGQVSSSDLIAKYNLTRPVFEEMMLFLEFNFVCCVRYIKEEDHWHEIATPFYEWQQYLFFLKETEAPPILNAERIQRKKTEDFAFIQDATAILESAQKKPQSMGALSKILPIDSAALSHLCEKLTLVKLATWVDGKLQLLEAAGDWLAMNNENKALYFYRHTHNRIISYSLPPSLEFDRLIREAEKSIRRVLHGQWVFFDDFVKGVIIPLSEHSVSSLKKLGKHWKYTLPVYGEEEKTFLHATIFEWFYECGVTIVGTLDGRDCFCVTPFGQFFFEE